MHNNGLPEPQNLKRMTALQQKSGHAMRPNSTRSNYVNYNFTGSILMLHTMLFIS